VRSDIAAFTASVHDGNLQTAISMYAGPFLEGLSASSLENVERWILHQRDRFALVLLGICERAVHESLGKSQPVEALRSTRRLVELHPEREDYRQLHLNVLARMDIPFESGLLPAIARPQKDL
jgi:hypothetical protein